MKNTILIILFSVILSVAVVSVLGAFRADTKLGVALQWNKFEKPSNTIHYASTTAGIVAVANYDRQFLTVVNIGTTTAYLWLNTSTDYMAANKGIPIAPMTTTTPDYLNSTYEIGLNNLYFGPVGAIADADTKLLIIEK